MELFSVDWFSALLSIIIIDLVLAGDNAIVIGMAARNVPKNHQKLVIFSGTAGAIIIRVLATFVVVWLLNIPGLHVIGGLLLIWIAYKLMVDHKDHEINAKNSVMSAIGTIIVADAAMGIDNVLAVAGAAHGDYTLVIIGLLISIPLVVWGSTMILKLIERYPIVIMIGAGVLAYTAAKMITNEGFLDVLFSNSIAKWGFVLVVVVATLWAGKRKQNLQLKQTA